MSKSATSKTPVNKVPNIEHPLKKLAKENSMDFSISYFPGAPDDGRAMSFEDEMKYKSRKSRNSSRASRSDTSMDNVNLQETFLTNIPESVSFVGGDTNATRLPVFGNRTSMQSRTSITSRQCSGKESERLSLEEITERIFNKFDKNYYEMRKKFMDNDPERKGNVQREALMRIIQIITGCEITNNYLSGLLEKWGLKPDKQMFSFNEIQTIFLNKSKEKSENNFLDPVNRQKSNAIVPAKMISGDAFEFLKEKFRSREMYLTDLFPESIESQTFSINKTDLKNALYKVLIDLIPIEMDKLWLKFDPKKQGSIDSMKFLKQMGIISHPIMSLTPRIKVPGDSLKLNASYNSLEDSLKSKLREGFITLGQDFKKKDVNQTGFLSIADFLQVLSDHNLHLEESNLGEFLSRCVITPSKDGIPYKEFLIRFQDRSEAGVTHKLLTDRNDKNSSITDAQMNPVSLLEMKLVNIFQKDFLEMLEGFRKLDKHQNGSVELKDFKRVLEKQMNTEFSETQFKVIVDNLPLNRNQTVPYHDFLKQFDTGNFSPFPIQESRDDFSELNENSSVAELNPDEIQSGKTVHEIKNIMKQAFDSNYGEIEKKFNEIDEYNSKTLNPESMFQLMKIKLDKHQNGSVELKDFKRVLEKQMNTEFSETQFKVIVDNLPLNRNQTVPYHDFLKQFDTGNFSPFPIQESRDDFSELNENSSVAELNPDEIQSGKTVHEIKNIMKQAFDSNYGEIEKKFNEIDEYNSKTLNPESMFQLMKMLNVKPKLSRGDIRSVWKTFILNERDLLDFKEFTRHFMYNKLTASYPNAKLNPPVKGDSDLMQRSKKLNAATDILLDNLRSKIDLMYNDLLKEFLYMDPNNTGEVSIDEFQDIIKEISIHLTDYEIEMVTEKFRTQNNKIAYIELLRPFFTQKSSSKFSENHSSSNPSKMISIKVKQVNGKDLSTIQLHQKLQTLTQPAMRRNMKKIDSSNSGLITLPELRALLLLEGISLSEDEAFNLSNAYDQNLNGSINYKMLLLELQSKI